MDEAVAGHTHITIVTRAAYRQDTGALRGFLAGVGDRAISC